MSAILPFYEEDEAGDPVNEIAFGAVTAPPPAESVIADLTRMHWMRQELSRLLKEREFRIGQKSNGHYAIFLDRDIPKDALPWSGGLTEEGHGKTQPYNLFAPTNTKMQCPIFDLPGAVAGQWIVPAKDREAAARAMLPPPGMAGEKGSMQVDVERSICSRCVTGDTRIMVRGRGLVTVESMLDEGEFEAWSGEAWRKTHVKMTGIRPTVTLRTNWGLSLRCTANHPIKTRVGEFVLAGDLEQGERLDLSMPDAPPMPENSDIVRGPERPPHHNSVPAHFPREWSYEVGIFLGYIMGNGSMNAGKYPIVSLCSDKEDAHDLERMRDIVRTWCGTETEVYVNPGNAGPGLCNPEKQHDMARAVWRVLTLADFLRDLGLDKSCDARDYRVPAQVFTASRDGARGFLSGLFSTDGSVVLGPNGKITLILASVSKRMLEETQQLLCCFGIRSSICAYTTSNEWRETEGYRSLFKLEVSAIEHVKTFQARIGFFNERKEKRLSDLLASDDRIGQSRYPIVLSVEENKVEEPVYDLIDVGEEHQFVANGLTIHNCYAGKGQYISPYAQAGEMVRYWWAHRCTLSTEGRAEFEKVIAAAVHAIVPKRPDRHGIKAVRVHSSGDFFSPAYFRMWLAACARVAREDPTVRFWFPTRVWGFKGYDWSLLAGHENMVIRPSAYHMNDAAPEKLHTSNARGTTAVYHDDNLGMIASLEKAADLYSQKVYEENRRRVASSQRQEEQWVENWGPMMNGYQRARAARRGFGASEYEIDPRYDWACQTYAIGANGLDLSPSCTHAKAPDGKIGCRACWTSRNLRVCYTAH